MNVIPLQIKRVSWIGIEKDAGGFQRGAWFVEEFIWRESKSRYQHEVWSEQVKKGYPVVKATEWRPVE